MSGARAFHLLSDLYGDAAMADVFSEERTIAGWLRVEAALAWAQADHGVLTAATAGALEAALVLDRIDHDRLWDETRIVGYPILPLIRQVAATLPDDVAGRLHFGATTQDIMDSALALQLRAAIERLRGLTRSWGDALATAAEAHATTVMAARTHNQQAVPTTLGAKWAVLLDELGRHLERLSQLERRACRVSLFGAGGTSAALGPASADVRASLARRLGLALADVPWHAARDGVAEVVTVFVLVAHTAARFAREVANLSRTEIGEVFEPAGHHRGASSTMPQKSNPIVSEAILGLAGTARGYLAPAAAAMVVEHERATGEWHLEWDAVPRVAVLVAGAVALAGELTAGLRVDRDAMARNLDLDQGLIMSEAFMIRLAQRMGQAPSHDLVYLAAGEARRSGRPLVEVLRDRVSPETWLVAGLEDRLPPASYVGEAADVARRAVTAWRHRFEGVPS